MEFLKNNKFIIILILVLSACGYIFLYIKEEKNQNILIESENTAIEQVEEIVEEKPKVYVDIAGEVINPGVYVLEEGSRVNDLLILAGGVTNEANLDNVNLAYTLTDGVKITIPNKKDNEKNIVQSSLFKTLKSEIININQATIDELTTLSGIGESIAEDIINYRKQNGNFKKKEDIKNVSGIGESKYSKIKDKITV